MWHSDYSLPQVPHRYFFPHLGVLPDSKVQEITRLIIGYCSEEQQRRIIHHTIDLGKTFAIFTNVDKAKEPEDRRQTDYNRMSLILVKNTDSLVACSSMIELYLSHWPTLLFFLQEEVTLSNFIISLKRKEADELGLVEDKIFRPIVTRCLNYNRKKLMKSNNIFSVESNYLVLRSLSLMHHLDQLPEFRELVYQDNRMPKLREALTEVMLDYFVGREKFKCHETSYSLLGSVKNVNYHQPQPKQSIPQANTISNNNIESFCS